MAVDLPSSRHAADDWPPFVATLRRILEESVAHGFFDVRITGEIIKGGQRCVTVSAGRSYRFYVGAAAPGRLWGIPVTETPAREP